MYDLEEHRAHTLNAGAAAVWRLWDGRRTLEEIGQAAAETLGVDPDPAMAVQALRQLERAGVLEAAPEEEANRRQLLPKLGWAAVAAPLVASIAIPNAAYAQVPGPTGPTGPPAPPIGPTA